MTDDPWKELRSLTVACQAGTKCPLCNEKWAAIAALVGEIVEDADFQANGFWDRK